MLSVEIEPTSIQRRFADQEYLVVDAELINGRISNRWCRRSIVGSPSCSKRRSAPQSRSFVAGDHENQFRVYSCSVAVNVDVHVATWIQFQRAVERPEQIAKSDTARDFFLRNCGSNGRRYDQKVDRQGLRIHRYGHWSGHVLSLVQFGWRELQRSPRRTTRFLHGRPRPEGPTS